ncbi:MAG: DUF1573 domain-containing protein [Bacteroidales bacterium]|nr:DUF1573 domain-containing protein [Bacteroidales bacterium]
MKKIIITLSILIFTSFIINAQVTNKVKPQKDENIKIEKKISDNPNAPEIEFDKLIHDYGTINKFGDGKCIFIFSNTGKEPLILSKVRSSCGCTVPKWPKNPILPGRSDTIKVKYDTKRLGIINKNVTVTSNAKTSPVILKIKGKVVAQPTEKIPEKQLNDVSSPVNR